MPIKIGGSHHLLGDVTVCTDVIFAKQIDTLMHLLEAAPGPEKLLTPPSPGTVKRGNIGIFVKLNLKYLEICFT